MLALAKVDNPKQLEGRRFVSEYGWSGNVNLLVGKNISFYGRLRYKTSTILQEFLARTDFGVDWKTVAISGIVSALLLLLAIPVTILYPVAEPVRLVCFIMSLPFLMAGFICFRTMISKLDDLVQGRCVEVTTEDLD